MIYTIRKICCSFGALIGVGLLALIGPATAQAGSAHGEVAVRPDLVRAGLGQKGESLIVSVWTRKPVPLESYARRPQSGSSSPFLCVDLTPPSGHRELRLCLGGPNAHRKIGLVEVNPAGRTTRTATLAARLKRPDPKHLVATMLPSAGRLAPHRYGWRVVERRPRCGRHLRGCMSRLPAGEHEYAFRLRPVRPVGCTGGSAGLVTNGPRDRPVVALTFDDGPSEYTPEFLDVLRHKHVPATFFEIGQEMAGRATAMRRILREGDEIGNHTMHHTEYPGYSEIAPDSALIERYTHFEPCLFRPPGGGADAAVISTAASLGMQSITWDVDPMDWSTPGTAAVYSRIVDAARPGSIILMHDGGGPRGETLAALPSIIDTLRGRGYRFATVSALLGHRLLYKPYG